MEQLYYYVAKGAITVFKIEKIFEESKSHKGGQILLSLFSLLTNFGNVQEGKG